uniref:thioredoxin-dependent peroxiredoxin n=1 Tax=Rhinopithecus roxellana TaxID=61622 RepID=A0A2K6P7W1_RHIRO
MSSGNAKIGHPAADFKATAVMSDGQFKDISLKYVVFFYLLDFTMVCPTEIIAFCGTEEFKKLNCQVIDASVDSHFCHLRTIAQDYGIFSFFFSEEESRISFRRLFIVDDTGILHDLPVDCSVDETLRLVQAFQFTDRQGEVCPAGWKPGSDTINSDVQKSKKYFSKQK